MKILVVCRWHGTHAAAFIMEQVDALKGLGHEVKYCAAQKGGVGYLDLYRNIRKQVRTWKPDVIHAHYGICGFVACLAVKSIISSFHQSLIPPKVVTTYPGSDINVPSVRKISRMCMRMSAYNVFMSKRQIAKVQDLAKPEKTMILRYGIMLDLFHSMDKMEARKLFAKAKPDEVNWNDTDKYVLFSSKFNRPVKDPDLAKSVIAQVNQTLNAQRSTLNVHLLPLTGGYTKEEMMWLMNAVDAALVSSISEGSPQFTKEVMACGTPIVSVDVGDVAEQLDGLDGSFIAMTREVEELAKLLLKAVNYGKTNGHQHIVDMCLSNEQIAQKLVEIYQSLLKK